MVGQKTHSLSRDSLNSSFILPTPVTHRVIRELLRDTVASWPGRQDLMQYKELAKQWDQQIPQKTPYAVLHPCREKILVSFLGISVSFLMTLTTTRGVALRHTCMSAAVKRYRYLRRLLKFEQMDFEFAIWQMTYLFINPQKVYRNFQYRKQTKSQFARDDPAFFVLLVLWLVVASVGFNFVLGLYVMSFIKFLLYMLFVDCLLVGLCVATLLWFVSNRYLLKPGSLGQDVEWGYAFDVHLNAFFPPLVILHVIQLFFYHVFISKDWFISRLFGNSLWLISFIYYMYITFLGYSSLQILHKTQVLLAPFIPLLLVFILSLASGWNVTTTVMNFYKNRVM